MSQTLIIISFLVFVSVSQDVEALKCHVCTSIKDPSCSDPFSPNATLTECPLSEPSIGSLNATVCRKQKQTIGGNVRVIRSCGYITDLTMNSTQLKPCFKNAFTSFTSSLYCDCIEEGCNSASGIYTNALLMTATAFVSMKCFLKSMN